MSRAIASFGRLSVIALITFIAALSTLRPAAADTCVPPGIDAIFIGKLHEEVGPGTAGTLYAFHVDSIERGDVPPRVLVDVAVDRQVRRPDGSVVTGVSFSSLGPPPDVGVWYRVEAYEGRPGGEPRLFANGCGGSLERLAGYRPLWSDFGVPTAVGGGAIVLLIVARELKRRSLVTTSP